MNLSLRWLGDYVSLGDISLKRFCDSMTMSGSKVESWHVEGDEIEKVVVGRVTEITPHPNAESLLLCRVDVGGESLQIVTGAKNLKAGDMVPVALDGATLPGGHRIATSQLRGEPSQGMLCSLAELGLTVNDFPNAVSDGIFVIAEPCAPGQDIREALGYNDAVVEFEITSNRPDCLSVIGLAREAAVTFGAPLSLPAPPQLPETGDIRGMLSVTVENTALCPRYVARAVTNVRIAPSPLWMRERLRASGVRPINNIVDITNYVMLEYGQPLHAFDINCVAGNKLVIRNAKPGETLMTLDGAERSLSPEMLVIADAQKPSAVAGVMGGENSGIHDDTVTVVFESANFLSSSVRTTAKKLGMRTEASSRFEKGLDPSMCAAAADRACELVCLLGAGEVVGGRIDVDHSGREKGSILLDAAWISRFIGVDIPENQMRSTLLALGFEIDKNNVTPPSWRADVRQKADLSEEVARFFGYDNIPSTVITGGASGSVTRKQKLERLAVSTLLSQGMSEICTYTFLSPKGFDKVRLPDDSPLRRTVKILNPLGEDTGIMRTCIYPSMMEALARNYANRNPSAALFELAKEFIPRESADLLPEENMVIALGMYGEHADYYTVKGAVEALLHAFGIRDVDVEAASGHPTFHPGRCAVIRKDGTEIALLGEAHPAVCANYDMDTRAYLARVRLDALFSLADAGNRTYRPLPRFPASTRDLALLCDVSLPVLAIEKAISRSIGGILESVELFDCYTGAQIPAGKKSLAFALVLRAADRTLTDTEVSAAMRSAVEAASVLGAELRV